MKLYIGNTYMGRLEDEYPKAMIMSVKKVSDMEDDEWDWRKDTVGRVGTMKLYKRAQLYCIVHETEFNYLHTSMGILDMEKGIITLRTRNTEYKFKILKDELTEENKCQNEEQTETE